MIATMSRKKTDSGRVRCAFGKRLRAAREKAGLAQAGLAEKLGLSQRTVAYWEQKPCYLLPEQLTLLADVLNVTTEDLLYDEPPKGKRGPTGRVKACFTRVTQLPKKEQNKIVDVVDALVNQASQGQRS